MENKKETNFEISLCIKVHFYNGKYSATVPAVFESRAAAIEFLNGNALLGVELQPGRKTTVLVAPEHCYELAVWEDVKPYICGVAYAPWQAEECLKGDVDTWCEYKAPCFGDSACIKIDDAIKQLSKKYCMDVHLDNLE